VTFSLGLFSHDIVATSLLVVLLIMGLTLTSYFTIQRLRHKKTRLAAVLVANTVATFMVVGLAFDIQVINKQPSMVYLVTNGTTDQQLETIDIQQPVFMMSEAAKSITNSNILDVATQIDIPSQMLTRRPTFDNLHVLGDGLSPAQWQTLQRVMGDSFAKTSVTFSASKPRIGLVNMHWRRELALGQYVEVKGQLQGTIEPALANNIYQLNLLDPVGQIVETIRLKASESFSLSFPAKSTGQWTYRLQLSKSDNMSLLADEPIAFFVAKPTPLRMLIKQSAPSFETRQLKNWAAEFGSQISVLTQISQNKDIKQNINLSAAALQQIISPFTEATLANVDWLLIDGRALLALTVQQISALHMAIKKGLGLYIIADKELVKAWPVPSLDWLWDINIQPLAVANYLAIPNWPHSKIEQAMPLVKAMITTAYGSSLVLNSMQPNNTQILVSHSKIGLGQVAVSLINTTYGWQTSGLTKQYSHYWQSVIYALARPKQTPNWLNAQPDALPLVKQPMQRCLLGATQPGVAIYTQNQQPLILSSDLLKTEQQCLTMWPAYKGWHKLTWSENNELAKAKNDQASFESTWFYAYAEHDWSEWQQVQKQQASQYVAKQQNTKQFVQSVKSLNKLWLWEMLVLSMSILWLERKLF
jgi:Kef-type K+ transport system membrane component KefB